MSYLEKTLLPNERVYYQGRVHWIIFNQALMWFAITWILSQQSQLVIYLAYVTAALFVTQLISATITFTTSVYAVTNKRVIMKVGFISRHSLEIFLNKIEALEVQQTIPGRILTYGTLLIVGTGGTRDPFKYLAEPFMFRRNVQQQIEGQQSS